MMFFWYIVFGYLIKRKGKKNSWVIFFIKLKFSKKKKEGVYQPMNMNQNFETPE
jgi:hypothetical protein